MTFPAICPLEVSVTNTTLAMYPAFTKDFVKMVINLSLLSLEERKSLIKMKFLRMKRFSNHNSFLTVRKVRDQAVLHIKILIPTANRYLRGLGLLGRIAKRVNYHSRKHISRRCQFCNSVKIWGLHKWRQVVFTDEVRIEMESQRRVFVRRNKARYCIKWKYSDRRSITGKFHNFRII